MTGQPLPLTTRQGWHSAGSSLVSGAGYMADLRLTTCSVLSRQLWGPSRGTSGPSPSASPVIVSCTTMAMKIFGGH